MENSVCKGTDRGLGSDIVETFTELGIDTRFSS